MALPRQAKLKINYTGAVRSIINVPILPDEAELTSEEMATVKYTVVPGENLWHIAKRFLGEGKYYAQLYDMNADAIEQAAREHGLESSESGKYLFPATVLTIPAAGNLEQVATNMTAVETWSGKPVPALGDKMADAATAFTYTDAASGQSDSISLTMHDIGREWMGALMPVKGADISVKLMFEGWKGLKNFDCGVFIVDDLSFSAKPTSCVLGAVSVPTLNEFKTLKRSQTYSETTFEEIAAQIAMRTYVALTYDALKLPIKEVEQSDQTDSEFLYQLCEKYGMGLKVYNYKLVVYSIVRYELKSSVRTITEADVEGQWKYNLTVDGTYTGVELTYQDPDKEDPIVVRMGDTGRTYKMNTQATSQYDGEMQAAAKANAANRQMETMSMTIRADTRLVATHCVDLSGFGKIDGKYFIDKIVHTLGSGGYKMQLTMHKVQTPFMVYLGGYE